MKVALVKRIEKLEAAGPEGVRVIIRHGLGAGTLTGFKVKTTGTDHLVIGRLEGETQEKLLERVKVNVAPRGGLVILEDICEPCTPV